MVSLQTATPGQAQEMETIVLALTHAAVHSIVSEINPNPILVTGAS